MIYDEFPLWHHKHSTNKDKYRRKKHIHTRVSSLYFFSCLIFMPFFRFIHAKVFFDLFHASLEEHTCFLYTFTFFFFFYSPCVKYLLPFYFISFIKPWLHFICFLAHFHFVKKCGIMLVLMSIRNGFAKNFL